MIGQFYPETAWEIARIGKLTASCFFKLTTEPKSKAAKESGELSEAAKTYIDSKAAEIVTGTIRAISTNATEWGKKYEPEAVAELKKVYPDLVYYGSENQVFFPYDNFSGGSPDAIMHDHIVFEGKCPEDPANHIAYCRMKSAVDMEREHYEQLQFNMVCVAKKNNIPFAQMKGVFFSYYPLVKQGFKKLHILKVDPDMEFYNKVPEIVERSEAYLSDVLESMKEAVSTHSTEAA